MKEILSRRGSGRLVLSGLLLAAFALSPALVFASPAAERGQQAYNEGQYQEAQSAFIEAIQRRPDEPELYRNLARAYFWQNQYSAATAYYDFYLRLAADAEDADQIRAERRLASNRASGEAWTMPEEQQMALRALRQELDEGRAYTAGAGGAWGLYRTLLRLQYAQPELSTMRRDLQRRLIDEFEGLLIPAEGQPAPVLVLEDWMIQKERLEAARTLSDDEVIVDMLDRRALIVTAATALLNHRLDEAVVRLDEAASNNPDMLFLNWYRIYALGRSGAYPQALELLEHFSERLARTAPHQLPYIEIMRASLLKNTGRTEDAARIYLEFFSESSSESS